MTVGYLVLTAVVGNLTSESSLIMKKLESNKRKSSMFVYICTSCSLHKLICIDSF